MSECSDCEREALDAEMAKCGLERCFDCSKHLWWKQFSFGCSNKDCSKNGAMNICWECVDEEYCEICSKFYCASCAFNEKSQQCDGCYRYSCGINDCNGESIDYFKVLNVKCAVLIAAQIAIHLFASVMSAKLLIAQNAVNKHSVKVVLNGFVIAAELFEVAMTVLMLPVPTVARYQKIFM